MRKEIRLFFSKLVGGLPVCFLVCMLACRREDQTSRLQPRAGERFAEQTATGDETAKRKAPLPTQPSGSQEHSQELETPVIYDFKPVQIGNLTIAPGHNGEASLVMSRGREVRRFSLKPGLICSDPAVEKDGCAVFFLVRKVFRMPDKDATDELAIEYYCLLKFDIPGDQTPLTDLQPDYFLYTDQLRSLFNGRAAWIEGLEGVSNNGEYLVIRVATEDIASVPHSVGLVRKACRYWLKKNKITEIEDREDKKGIGP